MNTDERSPQDLERELEKRKQQDRKVGASTGRLEDRLREEQAREKRVKPL